MHPDTGPVLTKPPFFPSPSYLQAPLSFLWSPLRPAHTDTNSKVPTLPQWLPLRSPLKIISLNPMNMFQSLSYFSGVYDLLPAPSSRYASFASLTPRTAHFPVHIVGLADSILFPFLVYPPPSTHQILEFLKPHCYSLFSSLFFNPVDDTTFI